MASWASSCHQVTGCKLLSLQSSELIQGAINQTLRRCEPLNVFLDFLWLFAHQCVNSPTLPTNHSHRATRRERRSARCFGIFENYACVCRITRVRACTRICAPDLVCVTARADGNRHKNLCGVFPLPAGMYHNFTVWVFAPVYVPTRAKKRLLCSQASLQKFQSTK